MREEDRRLPGVGIPQSLFSATYHVERRIRTHFQGTRLHWGLRRILQRLWIQDGLSQKELSDSVGSSETSISNMVKNLLRDGWIERRQDEYDYRISRIYLSDKAIHLKEAIAAELQHIDDVLRDALGLSDATELREQLDCMTDVLATRLEPHDHPSAELADIPSPPGDL